MLCWWCVTMSYYAITTATRLWCSDAQDVRGSSSLCWLPLHTWAVFIGSCQQFILYGNSEWDGFAVFLLICLYNVLLRNYIYIWYLYCVIFDIHIYYSVAPSQKPGIHTYTQLTLTKTRVTIQMAASRVAAEPIWGSAAGEIYSQAWRYWGASAAWKMWLWATQVDPHGKE